MQESSLILGLAGAVALALWAWDIAGARDPVVWRRWCRWILWSIMVLALAVLAWLHVRLDDLLDVSTFRIIDRQHFRVLHAWYLNISTTQWAGSLLLTATTLFSWRCEDRQ